MTYFGKSVYYPDGYLMSHDEFMSHYNVPITVKEYALVIGAVPYSFVNLCKGDYYEADVSVIDPVDTPCGKYCF